MTANSNPSVAFVDLDGTLTLENTYHLLLDACWRAGSWRTRGALAGAVARRVVVPSGGRLRLKRQVLKLVSDAPERAAITQIVVQWALRARSEPLTQILEDLAERGCALVLATAAADFYAQEIARQTGMVGCLATGTPVSGQPWFELSGERKRKACEEWLESHGGSAKVALVGAGDSRDDLPMLRMCQEVILQGPTTTIEAIHAALDEGSRVTCLDTQASDGGGGAWVWGSEGPQGPLSDAQIAAVARAGSRALIYVEPGRWVRLGARRLRRLTPRRRSTCPAPPALLQRRTCGVV